MHPCPTTPKGEESPPDSPQFNSIPDIPIASGWTECVPLLVREAGVVVDAVDRLRGALPFPLRAIDTDNGSEFLNEVLIGFCKEHSIGLTRSRPNQERPSLLPDDHTRRVGADDRAVLLLDPMPRAEALARLKGAVHVPAQPRHRRHQLRAEQAIRPAVVTRKMCRGNRSWRDAATQQTLASVIRTACQRLRNPHAVIVGLLRSRSPTVAPELQRPAR